MSFHEKEFNRHRIITGDSLEVLRTLDANSIDAIVCDPPYGLSKEPDMAEVLTHWLAGDDYEHRGGGFMGKKWDSFVPGPALWKEALRVLKPGGHLLAFAGTRTVDLMGISLRLGGFEIRDMIAWTYGSGFPKSHNVSKAIDKMAGAEREIVGVVNRTGKDTGTYGAFAGPSPITTPATDAARQWEGWGTALKPAFEPVIVARKPLEGTVAKNVMKHGTGGLNIDGCRVPSDEKITNHARSAEASKSKGKYGDSSAQETHQTAGQALGRFPANLIHDGSPEVLDLFPETGKSAGGSRGAGGKNGRYGPLSAQPEIGSLGYGDKGSAARFFYCAKPSKKEREQGLEDFEAQPFGASNQAQAAIKRGESYDGSSGINTAKARKNTHPTVKPQALMQYLCRLVGSPGGVILDPFAGSGTTGMAAVVEGFAFIGIERDEEYAAIAEARIRSVC